MGNIVSKYYSVDELENLTNEDLLSDLEQFKIVYHELVALVENNFEFQIEQIEKEERLQIAIDSIREKFGFTYIQKTNSLLEASRSIERSKLIGGHSAGGLDGLR